MSHPDKRNILKTRSRILQAIRDYFVSKNFLEVETPIRCPDIIPEAHIEPVESQGWFLAASPELCMKRLLSKGFDCIFQISKTFRKGERGKHHIPELTMLEWYESHATYTDLMDHCVAMIRFICRELKMDPSITYQNQDILIDQPWQRLSVEQAFDRYADTPLSKALNDDCFDEVISFQIEPNLGAPAPTFLMDYPAAYASLSQLKPNNPDYAQRVEFYIAGIELANGFTELTDTALQRSRFEQENKIRKKRGGSVLPLPEKFLKDLEKMPPAAGMALGIDRLTMILTDSPVIDWVLTFSPEDL